jgi:hypothetical protein
MQFAVNEHPAQAGVPHHHRNVKANKRTTRKASCGVRHKCVVHVSHTKQLIAIITISTGNCQTTKNVKEEVQCRLLRARLFK